jgi:hypothetical protein
LREIGDLTVLNLREIGELAVLNLRGIEKTYFSIGKNINNYGIIIITTKNRLVSIETNLFL